jgi:hypothetical protein
MIYYNLEVGCNNQPLILDVDGRNKNDSNRWVNNVFANDTKLLPKPQIFHVKTESIDRMHNDVFNTNNCRNIMKRTSMYS